MIHTQSRTYWKAADSGHAMERRRGRIVTATARRYGLFAFTKLDISLKTGACAKEWSEWGVVLPSGWSDSGHITFQ